MNLNQRSAKIQRGFGHTPTGAKARDASHTHWQLYQKQVQPLRELGRLSDAEPILNLLIQSRTAVPEVYRDLAALAEQRGEGRDADHWRDIWLAQSSNRPEPRWEQACTAESLGRIDQAQQHFQHLLSLQPRHLGALQHMARLMLKAGDAPQALNLFERWLAEAPDNIEARVCRAACLVESQHSEDAHFDLNGVTEPTWLQLSQAVEARLLQKQNNEVEALRLAERLLREAETRSCHWMIPRVLAPLLLEQQQLGLLRSALKLAIEEQPDSGDLRLLEAQCLLLKGHLQPGYRAFDLHQQLEHKPSLGHGCILPRWSAEHQEEPLVLIASGTLGDTLLLSRYAPWLQQRLQTAVQLYVQPPLLSLLKQALGKQVAVMAVTELRLQRSGSALPLASLPPLFGSSQEHEVLGCPHLQADPQLIEHWREQLQLQADETLIGLNWHGSALQALSERHSSDIPLRSFLGLSQVPGVRLLSLQKGIGLEQLKDCSFRDRFVSVQAEVNREQRLEHVAALMSLCRWVVCDDSGPAHLAGCLGVPGLVLLPERINWRWGSTEPDRSPWYPSLRLMRQRSNQHWGELVAEATSWIAERLTPVECDEEPCDGTAFK